MRRILYFGKIFLAMDLSEGSFLTILMNFFRNSQISSEFPALDFAL
jgi:hypothetical protein